MWPLQQLRFFGRCWRRQVPVERSDCCCGRRVTEQARSSVSTKVGEARTNRKRPVRSARLRVVTSARRPAAACSRRPASISRTPWRSKASGFLPAAARGTDRGALPVRVSPRLHGLLLRHLHHGFSGPLMVRRHLRGVCNGSHERTGLPQSCPQIAGRPQRVSAAPGGRSGALHLRGANQRCPI